MILNGPTLLKEPLKERHCRGASLAASVLKEFDANVDEPRAELHGHLQH